jgi:simple sugar transport system ATP-binding protein
LLANDVTSFAVHPGEVVALLGENGAGKSTLCKILYGYYRADSGEIRVAGQPAAIASPRDARRLGIGMVFQNFSLLPALPVWENVALFLDDVPWLLRPSRLRRHMHRLAERLRLSVDPLLPVGRLAVGDQQKVEILKQLLAGARVLMLDEPTKVLAPQEVDGLFRALAELRDDGYGVVFITHKLREVTACADRVAVMRQGRIVGTLPGPAATEATLLRLMFGDLANDTPPPLEGLGREADQGRGERSVQPRAGDGTHPSPRPWSASRPKPSREGGEVTPGDVVLELDKISTAPGGGAVTLRGLSCQVRGGEILGVAGVSGNGQRELADVILGLRAALG